MMIRPTGAASPHAATRLTHPPTAANAASAFLAALQASVAPAAAAAVAPPSDAAAAAAAGDVPDAAAAGNAAATDTVLLSNAAMLATAPPTDLTTLQRAAVHGGGGHHGHGGKLMPVAAAGDEIDAASETDDDIVPAVAGVVEDDTTNDSGTDDATGATATSGDLSAIADLAVALATGATVPRTLAVRVPRPPAQGSANATTAASAALTRPVQLPGTSIATASGGDADGVDSAALANDGDSDPVLGGNGHPAVFDIAPQAAVHVHVAVPAMSSAQQGPGDQSSGGAPGSGKHHDAADASVAPTSRGTPPTAPGAVAPQALAATVAPPVLARVVGGSAAPAEAAYVPRSADVPVPQPSSAHVTVDLDGQIAGASRIRVAVQGSAVQATIIATDGASAALDRALPALRQALEDRGFSDVKVAVRVQESATPATISTTAAPAVGETANTNAGAARREQAGDPRQQPRTSQDDQPFNRDPRGRRRPSQERDA